MQIIKTSAWKKPQFVYLVIKEILDPWPVIKNAPLFILYDKGQAVSFCTIKNWGTCIELGTVVTIREYRNKGYANKLIKYVLKDKKNIYIVCAPELIAFYKKFGFSPVKDAPYPIKQRVAFANFFAKLFGKKYFIMKK